MPDCAQMLSLPHYEMEYSEKKNLLLDRLSDLTMHHYSKCGHYKNILDAWGKQFANHMEEYADVPFLPVSLFKTLELRSIPEGEIYKTLRSSGTSGAPASRIFLDKGAASWQQRALISTFKAFNGAARLPLLIIDSQATLHDRSSFSARGAGILGFSLFGSDRLYALDEDMHLDYNAVADFLDRHRGEKILIFGFTYMIWQHLYKELMKESRHLDLGNSILFHGGGWKKLVDESVSPEHYKDGLERTCGISSIHNYYGMVEQIGVMHMECECGYLHTPAFAEVITRRPLDLSPCENGEAGVIQVLSALPESYPGHSLLTDDYGVVHGHDDCPCGRKGTYFSLQGRLPNAEIRGCSDAYS